MTKPNHVALLVTCLVDQIMPEVGVAAVRLLRAAGFKVEFPAAQTCCGQPFFNAGFRDEAAHLAKRTVEIFENYPAVVLPSGSCTSMVRAEYPHLLQPWPGWHRRAVRLAEKTYELSEFLVHHTGWRPPPVSDAPRVTYHDSCHMCRILRLRREPRLLLEAAGCTLVEMEEPDRCCGFGGLFSVKMPEVSNAMTEEKLEQAARTGSEVLITADPGCLMQMRGWPQHGYPAVEHLAVVLDRLLTQAAAGRREPGMNKPEEKR